MTLIKIGTCGGGGGNLMHIAPVIATAASSLSYQPGGRATDAVAAELTCASLAHHQ